MKCSICGERLNYPENSEWHPDVHSHCWEMKFIEKFKKSIKDRTYTIRKRILNIPLSLWNKIDKNFVGDIVNLTINEALTEYTTEHKRLSGNSCQYNEEEREFFDKYYEELRRRRNEKTKRPD